MMSVTVGRSKAVLLSSVFKEELCGGGGKCHSWIFLCFLERLNSHTSGGGFYTDDYAEHVSHQSQLNLMQGIKTLPFQEAIQG